MRIWLVAPAWKRFSVTRLALAGHRWLCDELAARGHQAHVVVVADDDNLETAAEFGFDALEWPNQPLGEKFNAAYRYAAEHDAELFVHIGSDDWCHPSVFDVLDTLDLAKAPEPVWEPGQTVIWRRGPIIVAQRSITLVDLPTGVVQRCTVLGKHGCIPWLIPRVVLEPVAFSPVQPDQARGIDGSLVSGLTVRPNWVYQDPAEDTCVDFKSGTNITPFHSLQSNLGYGDELTLDALNAKWPTHLVELAEQTHRGELVGAAWTDR